MWVAQQATDPQRTMRARTAKVIYFNVGAALANHTHVTPLPQATSPFSKAEKKAAAAVSQEAGSFGSFKGKDRLRPFFGMT